MPLVSDPFWHADGTAHASVKGCSLRRRNRTLPRSALAVGIFAVHRLPRGVHADEDHREEQDHRDWDDQDLKGTVEQVANHHAAMLAYFTVFAVAATGLEGRGGAVH